MKTIVITAIHGRKELTDVWLAHCKRIGLEVCAAYSDDEDKPDGVWSIQVENEPLAKKWQKAVDLARLVKADRYLILGSDDFISEKIFQYYDDFDFIGFSDMYFWNLSNNFSYYFSYDIHRNKIWKHRSETLGAGQMYSHSLLEKIDFKLFDQSDLPEHLRAHGTYLDQIGEHYARLNGTYKRYFMKQEALIMSPKIENCMHPFKTFFKNRTEKVAGDLFLRYFPVETLQEINRISEESRNEEYQGIPLPKQTPKVKIY